MLAKRLGLAAVLASLLSGAGCCRACRYWCDAPPQATPVAYSPAPAVAPCVCQPICCPPGTVPVQPVPTAPGGVVRPAFSPPNGCCYPQ